MKPVPPSRSPCKLPNPHPLTEGTPLNEPQRKALYRIPEAMRQLSLSRSVIYELIRSGRLRTVKQGRTRLVNLMPPEITDDEVLLRVRTVGFCGSDLNTYRGLNPLVRARAHGHPRALGEQRLGDAPADPRGGAGDERHAVLEAQTH